MDAPETLVLRTFQDLERALASPDPGVRRAVLETLARERPDPASYRSPDGRDLLDLLIDGRPRALEVLLRYGGERVAAVVREEWNSAGDDATLLALARWMAARPERDFLEPWLAGWDTRARLAASLLAGEAGLGPEQRLRIAVLGDHPASPLPEGPGGALDPLWRECLRRRPARTWALLSGLGEEALARVAGWWPDLDDSTRRWLAGRGHLPEAEVARETSLEVLRAAAGSGRALEALARHPDPRVRAEAIRGGAPVADPVRSWREAEDPEVRLALAMRLAEGDPGEAARLAGELLAHEDWRLRAAGVRALVALGRDGPARDLAGDPRPEVRAAALQVLGGLAQGP